MRRGTLDASQCPATRHHFEGRSAQAPPQGDRFQMALSIHPRHLKRYREVAKLFFRYGGKDLFRKSKFHELTMDEEPVFEASSSESRAVAVHDRPGDVLREQRRVAKGDGLDPDRAAAKSGTEDDKVRLRAAELTEDLQKLGPTFIKVGQFLSTRGGSPARRLSRGAVAAPGQVAAVPVRGGRADRLRGARGPHLEGVRDLRRGADGGGVARPSASRRAAQRPARLRSRCSAPTSAIASSRISRRWPRSPSSSTATPSWESARVSSPMLEEFRKACFASWTTGRRRAICRRSARTSRSIENIVVPSPVEDYVTARVLTMEFVEGRKVTSIGPLAKMEIDGAPLADDLCHAYLKQILVDGFFHADPHPGNVFLTDDGRLALLDLGHGGAGRSRHAGGPAQARARDQRGSRRGRWRAWWSGIGTPLADADPRRGASAASPRWCCSVQGLRMQDIALGRLLFERRAARLGRRVPHAARADDARARRCSTSTQVTRAARPELRSRTPRSGAMRPRSCASGC